MKQAVTIDTPPGARVRLRCDERLGRLVRLTPTIRVWRVQWDGWPMPMKAKCNVLVVVEEQET